MAVETKDKAMSVGVFKYFFDYLNSKKVSIERKINGKSLKADINLTPDDIGAIADRNGVIELTHIKNQGAVESGKVFAVDQNGDTCLKEMTPAVIGALPASYANSVVLKSGGTMTGNLDMGEKRVTNLAQPMQDGDAVNKYYVDKKHMPLTLSLTTEWVGDSAPYTQTITVTGIQADDNPHYGLIFSGTLNNKLSQKEAFGYIDEMITSDGEVTFICLENKPTVELQIQLEVNR